MWHVLSLRGLLPQGAEDLAVEGHLQMASLLCSVAGCRSGLDHPSVQCLEQKECCYSTAANGLLCAVQRQPAGVFRVAGCSSPATSLLPPLQQH